MGKAASGKKSYKSIKKINVFTCFAYKKKKFREILCGFLKDLLDGREKKLNHVKPFWWASDANGWPLKTRHV